MVGGSCRGRSNYLLYGVLQPPEGALVGRSSFAPIQSHGEDFSSDYFGFLLGCGFDELSFLTMVVACSSRAVSVGPVLARVVLRWAPRSRMCKVTGMHCCITVQVWCLSQLRVWRCPAKV